MSLNQEGEIILYIGVKVSENKERGRLIGTHMAWNDKMQLLLTSAEPAVGARLDNISCYAWREMSVHFR